MLHLTPMLPLLLAACDGPSLNESDAQLLGPGQEAWGEADVTCRTDVECLAGEVCLESVCQPERCQNGPYTTEAPVGEYLTFFKENEVAVADTISYDGGYWIDGYAPTPGSLGYDYSWYVSGQPITDIAGGSFTGERVEVYAATLLNKAEFAVIEDGGPVYYDLGFEADMIAGGDANADGFDDLVLASKNGDFALCLADADGFMCEYSALTSDVALSIEDVAMGDVDGDQYEEPVFLVNVDGAIIDLYSDDRFDTDGDYILYVLNHDAEESDQLESYQGYAGREHPVRIAAGDLDGDSVSEIIGLVDGDWWGWFDDHIATYVLVETAGEGAVELAFEQELDGYGGLVDLDAADIDGDNVHELYLLDEDSRLINGVSDMSTGVPSIALQYDIALSVSVAPTRVAMADHDGDSPRATLTDGPFDITAPMVPTMVLVLPPYDQVYSDGVSMAAYGEADSIREQVEDTTYLGLKADLGFNASFPFEWLKTSVGGSVARTVYEATGEANWLAAGGRYSVKAKPELYGPDYGAVVLSWGCFQGYLYEIDDPSQLLDEEGHSVNGHEFVLNIPVDGATSIWSTNRYNALAKALGDLPIIDIPYTIGDVDSYPVQPERLDGEQLDESDLVFAMQDEFRVSDIGSIAWYYSANESETYYQNTSYTLGYEVSVDVNGKLFGAGVGASGGFGQEWGWGQSYSIAVGTGALFTGYIPPIPDDPQTPEDEYALHSYAMAPVVYLHEYTDEDGNDAAYYVQTYVAER